MNCPHCGKDIYAKSRRLYFAKRHIDSGKAKVRTSVEQIGVCLTEGCNNEVKGRRWYCTKCRSQREKLRRIKREENHNA